MTQARIIDGTTIAKEIREETAEQIAKLGITPGLAVILAGDDPASVRYVRIKQKAAAAAGIDIHVYKLLENALQGELMKSISFLNADKQVHALLVQLPLPAHMDEDAAIRAMDPKKDVDGFHPENILAFLNDRAAIAPGLVMGIIQLITATKEPLAGKTAVIVAKSREFTDTLSHALSAFGIASQAVRPDAANIAQKTQSANMVITAAGSPGWLTRDMVQQGAILIDVGTTDVDGTITGDVHPSCKEKAKWISPVPGGVGPMTVAMLLKNTAMLARIAEHADSE